MVALAWNCTDNAITGISPFEAEHGMKPRTATETFLETPPKDGLAAGADDLRKIAISVKAYQQQAALAKTRTAQFLNKTGHKFDYEVGDRVAFFIPPSQKEAQKAGRKAKHLLKYRGPAESLITGLITGYSIRVGIMSGMS